MPNIQDKKRSWLFRATRGIRFKPDREAVETELREHMEKLQDKVVLDTRHICFLPGTHRL